MGRTARHGQYVARFPEHAAFIQYVFTEAGLRTRDPKDNEWLHDTPRNVSDALDTPEDVVKGKALQTAPDLPSTREGGLHARFQIVRNLASGGIGTVYVGWDRDLDREVAIKVLKRRFASGPGRAEAISN